MRVVEIKGMSKRFGNKVLFNDFCCSINKNNLVAICGKSGCGKSTLLNIIGGLETFDSGEVIVLNKDIRDYTKKEKRELYKFELGFLFQNYALIEDEMVFDNLIIPIRKKDKKEQKKEIEETLKKVGLEDKMYEKVNTLSGGEQQRVALARLLLKPCQIILADEPTGNLDEYNKKIIFDILNSLKKEKTIILVTHDVELANLCDAIIQL